MHGANALGERTATAAEIIEYFRADYRLRVGLDPEVDEGVELDASATIAEWRAACDLVSVSKLARAMNGWLGMKRPEAEWRAVLTPEHSRTLGELADFVASDITWPQCYPVALGGAHDAAAGAFFAVRGLLARSGEVVDDMRPSTPIHASHVAALGDAMARLAPELVPEPTITHTRIGNVGGAIGLIGVVVTGYGLWTLSLRALGPGLLALAGGFALARVGQRLRFGEFRTLGEVARAIADRRSGAT